MTDIEQVLPSQLRLALASQWPSLYTSRTVPADRRPYMVTVRRDGGTGPDRFRDAARVAVNVYAPTELDANRLASDVRTAIEGMDRGRPFKRVGVSGPSTIPDTQSPQRYLTAEIYYRKETVV